MKFLKKNYLAKYKIEKLGTANKRLKAVYDITYSPPGLFNVMASSFFYASGLKNDRLRQVWGSNRGHRAQWLRALSSFKDFLLPKYSACGYDGADFEDAQNGKSVIKHDEVTIFIFY